MKKTRLLSLLLSAALVVSSVPMMATTVSAEAAENLTAIGATVKIPTNDASGWIGLETAQDLDDPYYEGWFKGTGWGGSLALYDPANVDPETSTNLSPVQPGTYVIVVEGRVPEKDEVLAPTSQSNRIYEHKRFEVRLGASNGGGALTGTLNFNGDWSEQVFKQTTDKEPLTFNGTALANFYITPSGTNNPDSIKITKDHHVPLDIKSIKVIEASTYNTDAENVVYTWGQDSGVVPAEWVSLTSRGSAILYPTWLAAAADATSATYDIADETLAPGTYELSGNFWTNEGTLDLTAVANSGAIPMTSDNATVTTEKAAKTFSFTVTENATLADIGLAWNAATGVADGEGEAAPVLNMSDLAITVKDLSYALGLSTTTANPTVTDTVYVAVNANKAFAAAEIEISYDTDYLEYVGVETGSDTCSFTDPAVEKVAKTGVISIKDYGADNTAGAVYTLQFKALAATSEGANTLVTITSAGMNDATYAETQNVKPVEILDPASVEIDIDAEYEVTIDPEFFDGASTVLPNANYEFTVKNEYYDYTVSATMGGVDVTVNDNGTTNNGPYVIENVTADIVITATRTPKTYTATIVGSGEAFEGELPTFDQETPTYGTDLTFTLPVVKNFTYTVESAVYQNGGSVLYDVKDGVVTIAGTAVTDHITVTINKAKTTIPVTVEGAVADAEGYEANAIAGENYVLAVTQDPLYDYVVTVSVDGAEAETLVGVANDETGKVDYTLTADKFTEDTTSIAFVVTKTLKTGVIAVDEYITLDGDDFYLVTYDIDKLTDGRVVAYNGANMFWSDKYGAYAYIVVADDMPTTDEVFAALSIISGTAVEIVYDYNVNKSAGDKVDANDAQLVYNMYNGAYAEFTENVTMEKFLKADVNELKGVDTNDAAAIVTYILNK